MHRSLYPTSRNSRTLKFSTFAVETGRTCRVWNGNTAEWNSARRIAKLKKKEKEEEEERGGGREKGMVTITKRMPCVVG